MTTRFAEPMSRLIEELRKLPGIGTKSAQRLAFHVLRSSDEDASALAHAIEQLKQHLRLCSICNNITDVDPCTYCTNPTPQSTPHMCSRRADQHRHHRKDARLQRRLPYPSRHVIANQWSRPRTASHRQPPHPRCKPLRSG